MLTPRRILSAIALLLTCAVPAHAQSGGYRAGASTGNSAYLLPQTVSALAGYASFGRGTVVAVKDGTTSTDCATGGGSNQVVCIYTGSAWTAASGTGTGSVTTFSATVPSWLAASVATPTTTPALTIAPASAQTSHQVIGTCGSATSFAPCALVAGDIPQLAYASLSGLPTLPANTGAVAHQWLSSYTSGTGAFGQAQPNFADLAGSIGIGQTPLTTNNDVLTVAAGVLVRLGLGGAGTFLGNCSGSLGFCTPSGGVSPSGATDAMQYNAGAGALGGVTPPTANGVYACGYNVTGGVAVAPTCPQEAASSRSITGTATTDIVAASDFGEIVTHDQAATGAVNETLPTATTLTNSQFYYKYCNHSPQTDTITPTTWTIQVGNLAAGSSASVPSGACLSVSIDPNNATQWHGDIQQSQPTASQLPVGIFSCTEVWSGSGTSSALQSGDDAISDNTCYNDSGSTRTITAVKCRSSAASNTTTTNPTFGSAGTGTTILSAALTCGSSYAESSSGTIANSGWTTGTGIDPGMGGTLTGTSIALLIEYHY